MLLHNTNPHLWKKKPNDFCPLFGEQQKKDPHSEGLQSGPKPILIQQMPWLSIAGNSQYSSREITLYYQLYHRSRRHLSVSYPYQVHNLAPRHGLVRWGKKQLWITELTGVLRCHSKQQQTGRKRSIMTSLPAQHEQDITPSLSHSKCVHVESHTRQVSLN